MDCNYVIPVNLYGPHDCFEDDRSHVIPALIKKILKAKEDNTTVEIWGTGTASREFLFVRDAAKAIKLALKEYHGADPINIGTGSEITIKALVELICEIIDFQGSIVWNSTKPDGQPRRQLDTSKAEKLFGFKAQMDLKNGLRETIQWYARKNNLERLLPQDIR